LAERSAAGGSEALRFPYATHGSNGSSPLKNCLDATAASSSAILGPLSAGKHSFDTAFFIRLDRSAWRLNRGSVMGDTIEMATATCHQR
jgi:hypothetical protein